MIKTQPFYIFNIRRFYNMAAGRMYRAVRGRQSKPRSKPKSKKPSVKKQTVSNTKAIRSIRKNQNQPIYYKAQFSGPLTGIPWTCIPLMGGPSSGSSADGGAGGDDASSIWSGSFNDPNGTNVGNLAWKEQFGVNDNRYEEEQTLKVNSLTMDFQLLPSSENDLVNYSVFIVSLKKDAISALDRPFLYQPPSEYRQGTVSSNYTVALGAGSVLTALASGTHYYNDQDPNAQLVSSGGAFTRLNPKYFKIHKEWRINTQGSSGGSTGGLADQEQNQLITNGSMGYFRRRHYMRLGNTIKNTAGTITQQMPAAIAIKDRKYMLIFHDGYNQDGEFPNFSLLLGYNCTTQR